MAPLRNLNNEKGHALVEGLFGLSLFASGTGLCLTFLYIISIQTWLFYLGHMGLLCVAEGHLKSHCSQKLKNQARVAMKMGRVQNIRFTGHLDGNQHVRVQWILLKYTFQTEQSIAWKKVLMKRDL